MKIINQRPPNYEKIVKAFPLVANGGVIYCYGDAIYNPDSAEISGDNLAHESVHSRQQGDDPEAWWNRYLTDQVFRLSQEIEAYRASYRYYVDKGADRNRLFKLRRMFAGHLSHPIYGENITKEEAFKKLGE